MSGNFDFANTSRYRKALERGVTFSETVALRDTCTGDALDLTGYTAAFVVYDGLVVKLSATTANGRVVIDKNVITVTVAAADTAGLAAGAYEYLLDVTQGSAVKRLLTGKFEIV